MTRARRRSTALLAAGVVAAVLGVAATGGAVALPADPGGAVALPADPGGAVALPADPGVPAPGASTASRGTSDPAGPRDYAAATASAQALRQRIETLQARIEAAVARWSEAQDALAGAAAAEAEASRRYDLAQRAAAQARANAARTARALYMIGGPGSLVASVLAAGSIDGVLDGVTALQGMVTGTGVAFGARAAAAEAVVAADRDRAARRLTSDERVRLAAEAAAAAAEAETLQLQLDAQLRDADATVQRLLAQEQQRAAAEQAAEAAREAAAAQAEAARRAAAAGLPAPTAVVPVPGALSPMELVAVFHQVGFDGEGLRIAWAVAMRESGGRPSAIGAVNPNGTRDHGLFQINDIHIGRWIAPELVYDPISNARAAYVASRGGTEWGSWGLGTSGWAGHLRDSIPAVHAALQARYQYWYDRFPLA